MFRGKPACVTVKVWFPTVITPVRLAPVVFAETLKAKLEDPVPLPTGNVSHEALLVADHTPSLGVTATMTLPLPEVAASAAVGLEKA